MVNRKRYLDTFRGMEKVELRQEMIDEEDENQGVMVSSCMTGKESFQKIYWQ